MASLGLSLLSELQLVVVSMHLEATMQFEMHDDASFVRPPPLMLRKKTNPFE